MRDLLSPSQLVLQKQRSIGKWMPNMYFIYTLHSFLIERGAKHGIDIQQLYRNWITLHIE